MSALSTPISSAKMIRRATPGLGVAWMDSGNSFLLFPFLERDAKGKAVSRSPDLHRGIHTA